MPAPNRISPDRATGFLHEAFGEDWLALPGAVLSQLVRDLADRGISGGAVYDGLIGATVKSVGSKLYTCDRRARVTYELVGVEVEFIG